MQQEYPEGFPSIKLTCSLLSLLFRLHIRWYYSSFSPFILCLHHKRWGSKSSLAERIRRGINPWGFVKGMKRRYECVLLFSTDARGGKRDDYVMEAFHWNGFDWVRKNGIIITRAALLQMTLDVFISFGPFVARIGVDTTLTWEGIDIVPL